MYSSEGSGATCILVRVVYSSEGSGTDQLYLVKKKICLLLSDPCAEYTVIPFLV